MRAARRWAIHGAVLALVASLSACGGGGGGGSSNTGGDNTGNSQSAAQITGVAAVGAPLVGTVTVKDANGVTRTSTIGTNGSYTVDVSGLTAPFVFRAEGTANGVHAIVHSIATQADVNGKINVTQLTDLIVSNIAGQLAQNFFDHFEQSGNANLASADQIKAEVDKLKEKLLPVLTALGVDTAIDLLHDSFTPKADAIDQALDVIRVSYDTTANTATISNVVNTTTVADALAVPAAQETSPPTLSATNVASAPSDAEAAKAALQAFAAKFATGLPTAADLTPLMTTGFLWGDLNRTTAAAQLAQESSFVGVSFTDVELRMIDYANVNGVTAHLSFSVKTASGVELGRLENWKVRKSPTDGIWRLHGDQRTLNLEWFAVTAQHHNAPNSEATCVQTGLEFNIENPNSANDGGTIAAIVVKGPGLPPAGVRYLPPTLGGRWMIEGTGIETYYLASSCGGVPSAGLADAQIAAIPDNAAYTLTALDSGGATLIAPTGPTDGIYRFTIPRRPLTLAEAGAAGVFPVFDAATLSAFSAFDTSGGTIAFGAGNAYPWSQAYVQMRRYAAGNVAIDSVENSALPSSAGLVSSSISFGADATVASQVLWVESPDAFRRSIQTYYHK